MGSQSADLILGISMQYQLHTKESPRNATKLHSTQFTQGLNHYLVTTQVQFGRILIGSTKLSCCLNLGPDLRFGSGLGVNFELDFGQVHKSSGLNCGITSPSSTANMIEKKNSHSDSTPTPTTHNPHCAQ